MGTLGVILRAKAKGRIASAGAVVTALRAAGGGAGADPAWAYFFAHFQERKAWP